MRIALHGMAHRACRIAFRTSKYPTTSLQIKNNLFAALPQTNPYAAISETLSTGANSLRLWGTAEFVYEHAYVDGGSSQRKLIQQISVDLSTSTFSLLRANLPSKAIGAEASVFPTPTAECGSTLLLPQCGVTVLLQRGTRLPNQHPEVAYHILPVAACSCAGGISHFFALIQFSQLCQG